LSCNARRYGCMAVAVVGVDGRGGSTVCGDEAGDRSGDTFCNKDVLRTTRCRDTERANEGPPVVAIRAGWRVVSRTPGALRVGPDAPTGGAAWVGVVDDDKGMTGTAEGDDGASAAAKVGGDGAGDGKNAVLVWMGAGAGVAVDVGRPKTAGRPCAVSAFTTASQPCSSVLMRSRSSWFSLSRACSRSVRSLSSSATASEAYIVEGSGTAGGAGAGAW
jgi:hypothetical protein